MRYIDQMVHMRKEQFDVSVFRSLGFAAREVEQNETFRYLEQFTSEKIENDSLSLNRFLNINTSSLKGEPLTDYDTTAVHQSSRELPPFILHTTRRPPRAMPKVLRINRNNSIDEATRTFQEYIKNAYVYHKGLLDDVIYTILYKASEKPLEERINFRLLDQDIKNALESNSIDIPYHFTVSTADGREVYRCPDYEEKGNDYNYSQVIFPGDPTGRMGVIKIHFPDMHSFLFQTAGVMIPALVFTIILFITFVYTIFVVFRQKKITEMKNDFINNMTHEFKTPLSSISLAAQMLADRSVNKSETMTDNLTRVIGDETKRLRFQVEKVLQMSLYDRDNIAFNQKTINAHELLQTIIKTFSLKVSQNGGNITSDFRAQNANIYVDEMHFTNVVFNLMDNAVKYKRDNTPLQLTVTTQSYGERIRITIADNGIGINKDDLKRIFEKFYRVHTGNKHDVKGFGLGLAYVKKIVTLHNGTITAESEIGHGTQFVITLPTIKQ